MGKSLGKVLATATPTASGKLRSELRPIDPGHTARRTGNPARPCGPAIRSDVVLVALASSNLTAGNAAFGRGRLDTWAVFDRRLVLLALGAFVVASDGTLVIGLLRQIAGSLSVSPASAGQAVTVFAVVYALGAPLLI